ncbi:MAG: LD-carboxypeptidase [Pseudobacteriovorax sp.]|nr:LD-carboxypeptidase [Pseudobacteriovorax sp.]
MQKIRIIHPSSKATEDTLSEKIIELKKAGYHTESKPTTGDPIAPWLSNPGKTRLNELNDAINDPSVDIILCGRGGYGCSDLLPDLNWKSINNLNSPKLLCGFSDISALLAAFYDKPNWSLIHGPMINTKNWRSLYQDDVQELLNCFNSSGGQHTMDVSFLRGKGPLEGRLFGGCLSVLTNLIGTSFLPEKLDEHILIFEDVNESIPKIIRNLNQWHQCGLLTKSCGIILGDFIGLDGDDQSEIVKLAKLVEERYQIPVAHVPNIGHGETNFPFLLGAKAVLDSKHFIWEERGL